MCRRVCPRVGMGLKGQRLFMSFQRTLYKSIKVEKNQESLERYGLDIRAGGLRLLRSDKLRAWE